MLWSCALTGVIGLRELAAEPNSRTPQRIVAMAPNTAEVICALSACDRIVGVSRFCVYPAELQSRPRIGGLSDPDLERIIALRPDLLVMRGRVESLERLAERLQIPIYRDETDTFDGLEKCVREVGELLGRSEKAKEINVEFRRRLGEIRERTANLPRPRVLLTVARDPARIAGLLTAGRGTFLNEMIDAAGGVNVFGHLDMIYPQVSPESVVAAQPDVIIELLPEVALTEETKRELMAQWHQLGSLPATTNNRVYFLNDENCLIPSPRYLDIVDKVSRLLHPD